MVGAGNNGSVERIVNYDERVNACWYRSYAMVSPCTHSGSTYTVNGTDADGTHTRHCRYCSTTYEDEKHDFVDGECSVCHLNGTVYTVTIYLPDANDDDTYTNDGAYKTYTYDMVAGTSFTLPNAPQDLQDMDFAGWLVTTDAVPSFSTYKISDSETLWAERTEYTLNENVSFVARYKDIVISLADDSDNGETLYTYDGRIAASVTLTGRKLYKEGFWNTLCLPFSLSAEQIAASDLAGADIRAFSSAVFDDANGTLTLNFTDNGDVTNIEGGKPYIIKWEGSTGYVGNPTFSNVTINNALTEVESADGKVTFVGTYSRHSYTEVDHSVLFLGANNTLYYPQPVLNDPSAAYDAETNPYIPVVIGACRAYFQLGNGITAGEPTNPQSGYVRQFVLNFGEESTGVTTPLQYREGLGGESSWFTIDGRRLSGKPTAKGVYINNSRKVFIK